MNSAYAKYLLFDGLKYVECACEFTSDKFSLTIEVVFSFLDAMGRESATRCRNNTED